MDDSERTGEYSFDTPEPLEPGAQPQFIGRYRIEKVLGKGGFGLVHLAFDDQLQRLVAIKVPYRHRIAKAQDAEAYRTEARTVANLDHPHIVPVYDIGSTSEYPFFIVSKYIEGRTLAERIGRDRPSFGESAQLIATISEALHHAHGKGLVHRDIKPGNILIDLGGRPYLVDFGLALKEENIGRGPRAAGTPAYMSPEQARGEGHRVDGRSDVFSLGVVLYELLTGRRPFKGETNAELLEQIGKTEARPPRQIEDGIPPQLERICLKALSKLASERYTTAKDMADDLRQTFELPEMPATPSQSTAWESILATTHLADSEFDSISPSVVPKGLRAFDTDDADFFLGLIPGPRDRHGLPDAIRFWKSRIEKIHADETFSIGLLYGPSGCGKSSLVKAGLLPLLSQHVKTIYLESTGDLESRILQRLIRICPLARSQENLTQALAAIRREGTGVDGQKVLIVLDQFEQWLHANPSGAEAELVHALRQCDGGRVQCLIMVRDDFWMMSSRFMRELEVLVAEGQNAAAVDLFSPAHARKVLMAFGRAYGTLPARSRECTPAQTAFLDRAVAELVQGGWVTPIRLALFADMVKRRPWTGKVLRELGGAQGIGVAFLDEAFTAMSAPPENRRHQTAVRNVLNALLPSPGSNIKGHMRTRQELLEASGYWNAPPEFAGMMRVLISETRLLSPMASDRTDTGDTLEVASSTADSKPQSHDAGDEYFYQLTHDYLIPPIREWLARSQRVTWRGRAELRLAAREALWKASPERRQLPSLGEWLAIRLLTRRASWTDDQRQMMRSASRRHTASVIQVAVAVFAIACGMLLYRGRLLEEKAENDARALVARLLDADLAETPAIIDELYDFRRWADPILTNEAVSNSRPERRLRARLALLPVDSHYADELRDNLLNAEAKDFSVLRAALAPHRDRLVEACWTIVKEESAPPNRRFRAAAALASFAPLDSRWNEIDRWTAGQLLAQPSLVRMPWVAAFRAVKQRFIPILVEQVGAPTRSSTAAAEIIVEYAGDRPDVLTTVLADAGPEEFAIVYPALQSQPQPSVAALSSAFEKWMAEEKTDPNETAGRRANLAIALARLGQWKPLRQLLKTVPDPRARSFAIDRLAALGCDPQWLLAHFEQENDDGVRAALLLSLSGFDVRVFSESQRKGATADLAKVFRNDPNAAVHAAAGLLLTRWGVVENLPSIERKGWYLNSSGFTMIRIAGPVEFMMGCPPDEPGANAIHDPVHPAKIDYSFDLGMNEVTIGQFRRFRDRRPDKDQGADELPVTKLSWYEAAEYCNWLSKAEGISSEQWCYEPNDQGLYAEGMRIVAGCRGKIGYRLPTEEEWEFACRGGTITSRSFGDAVELLPRYVWYAANSTDDRSPIARLLPNQFGFFDMLGNAPEWCQGEYTSYSNRPHDDLEENVENGKYRAVRGGHFANLIKFIRSGKRFSERPTSIDSAGFRVARSRP